MTKEEKEAVLHCLRSMIDEELCEECPLYGTTGTDHCEKDCVRLAIEELEQENCNDCKYFEYNIVVKVDEVPLIMAHEICSKWGDGCKTSENGYCFLFEPKESEVQE